MENQNKLSLKFKCGYMCGGAAGTTVVTIVLVTLTYFYTNVLGLDVGKVAFVMLISRFFDGFSDAAAGLIIDRTRSKHGKARPWILWMLFPNLISIIALYTVPGGSETAQMIYIFCAYNFASTIVNTMIGLALSTLNSLMTQDPIERASLNVFRQFGAPVMELLISVATIPAALALGGDQKAWIIVVSIFAVISTFCYFLCFKWSKEIPPEELGSTTEKIPIIKSIKSVIANKYWWIALLTWGMCTFYMTASGTINSYYCQYIMGNVTYMSAINMVEKTATIVLTAALVPFLIRRLPKRKIMMFGAFVSGFGHLIVFIDPTSLTFAVAAAILRGCGIAACYGVLFAIIADTVEYGQWKSGIRTEGLIFSAATLGQKFSSGIAAAIVGGLLSMVHYDGTLAVQNEAAQDMISYIYFWGPPIFFGIIVILMIFYRLEKSLPRITEELKQRGKDKI